MRSVLPICELSVCDAYNWLAAEQVTVPQTRVAAVLLVMAEEMPVYLQE